MVDLIEFSVHTFSFVYFSVHSRSPYYVREFVRPPFDSPELHLSLPFPTSGPAESVCAVMMIFRVVDQADTPEKKKISHVIKESSKYFDGHIVADSEKELRS